MVQHFVLDDLLLLKTLPLQVLQLLPQVVDLLLVQLHLITL